VRGEGASRTGRDDADRPIIDAWPGVEGEVAVARQVQHGALGQRRDGEQRVDAERARHDRAVDHVEPIVHVVGPALPPSSPASGLRRWSSETSIEFGEPLGWRDADTVGPGHLPEPVLVQIQQTFSFC
jgi:hypothetical protein